MKHGYVSTRGNVFSGLNRSNDGLSGDFKQTPARIFRMIPTDTNTNLQNLEKMIVYSEFSCVIDVIIS